jgi:hypothetical protein
MDVARKLPAITFFALLNAIFALPAAGQSDWRNMGPTTPPTITASQQSYDRYGNPQTATRTTAAQPQSISDRAQNAVTETAGAFRDGFDATVRAASQQFPRTNTTLPQGSNQQAPYWPGATTQPTQTNSNSSVNRSQTTNPFVTPTQTSPKTNTNPSARSAVGPPPGWPGSTTASPPANTPGGAAPSWPGPSASADRSVATGGTPSANNPWNNPGSAAQTQYSNSQFPAAASEVGPIGNSSAAAGQSFASDSYRNPQSAQNTQGNPSQPAGAKSGSEANNWVMGWNNSDAPKVTIARGDANASRDNTKRSSERTASQSTMPQLDVGTTNVPPSGNFAGGNAWNQQQQSAPTASSNNSFGANQLPVNATVASAPAFGSTPPNGNYQPAPSNTPAGTNGSAAANHTSPSAAATAEKPWVTFIAVILSLAGSLAGNLFLGWSYIDARQKYQSLVRRTADTFRRARPAAA